MAAYWKQSARAEFAKVRGLVYGQALLDLVKAFDRIPYAVLMREAERLHYPKWLLKLAIATYRPLRVLRVGSVMSDIMRATRGVTAGAGIATTDMRIVMIDIIDSALAVHRHI